MKATDKAWIAGFFDGEGCLTIGRDKHHATHLNIVQKDKTVLKWIQKITKLGTINKHDGIISKCHALGIHRQSDIKKFLLLIIPYIKVKKKDVALVLPMIDLIIKRTTNTKKLSEDEIKKRNSIYLKWKKHKKKQKGYTI